MRLSSFARSLGLTAVLASGLMAACANSPDEGLGPDTGSAKVDSGSSTLPGDDDDDDEVDSGVTQARDPEDAGHTSTPKDAGTKDSGGSTSTSKMCTGDPIGLGAQLALMIALEIQPTPCDQNTGAGCKAGECCFGGVCLIGN